MCTLILCRSLFPVCGAVAQCDQAAFYHNNHLAIIRPNPIEAQLRFSTPVSLPLSQLFSFSLPATLLRFRFPLPSLSLLLSFSVSLSEDSCSAYVHCMHCLLPVPYLMGTVRCFVCPLTRIIIHNNN